MVYKLQNTVTVSAGSGSQNTLPIHGICQYIYIEPTTSTTTYKVTITDDDDDTVKEFEWKQGVFRDFTSFIVEGIYTISITESTANEDFTVKLLVREL